MDGSIETEIAVAMEFTEIPLDWTGDPEEEKRDARVVAHDNTDALRHERGDEAHEGNSHGKAIPEKSRVGGMPVIVAGTERGEEEAKENEGVGLTFAAIEKRCG